MLPSWGWFWLSEPPPEGVRGLDRGLAGASWAESEAAPRLGFCVTFLAGAMTLGVWPGGGLSRVTGGKTAEAAAEVVSLATALAAAGWVGGVGVLLRGSDFAGRAPLSRLPL